MSNTTIALPTPAQLAWQDMELAMFIHMDPCVWQNTQGSNALLPLDQYNPERLDAEQWVDVAVSLGARLVLLVCKHRGGFCMWQTETSNYGVKDTPWRGGKGDIVGDVSAACRRRGLKFGVYLAPQDLVHGAGLKGLCRTAAAQEAYNRIFRQQLTELLTRYGDVHEVWFDGSLAIEVGDILSRKVPDTMIFQSPHATIRWVGTESGFGPYPGWNAVTHEDALSGVATAAHGNPDGDVWLPLEVDTTIRDHQWFWNEGCEDKLKSLDHLMNTYYQSVGHGAVLLLNANPDRTGLVPEADARRAAEFGAEIRRRFATAVAETSGEGTVVELPLKEPTVIDHVVTMEDIVGGERIRAYAIEGLINGQWQELVTGSAVGHKKIDFFPPQTVAAVRLNVRQSAGQPLIRQLGVYHAGVTPAFERNRVRIEKPTSIGSWADAGSEWTTRTFDITEVCRQARQYTIRFMPAAGTNPYEIELPVFVQDAIEIPGFVTEIVPGQRYRLNVTAASGQKALRFRVRSVAGTAAGSVIVA